MANNAQTLSSRLSVFNHADVYPAMLNGQRFYRVRLGPVSSVEEADELLARLVQAGHSQSIIVVE